ncbi:MAG TPA: hypothetical protein VGR21_03485 [Cryptosporangiaceae bacterium]|nr:hypothetical protein [Cryptosporangiaceae bacterium]
MGALTGFVVGFWLGTQAGKNGVEEMIKAGKQIAQSEEFKSVVSSAAQMAGSVVSAGASMATGRLGGGQHHQAPTGGNGRAGMRVV